MEPLVFLDTAKKLFTDKATEGELRSVASRAYYSCFLKIRARIEAECANILFKKGIKNEKMQHEKMQSYLKGGGTVAKAPFVDDLIALCTRRVKADYILSKRFLPSDAELALDEAKLIIEALNELQKEQLYNILEDYFKKFPN